MLSIALGRSEPFERKKQQHQFSSAFSKSMSMKIQYHKKKHNTVIIVIICILVYIDDSMWKNRNGMKHMRTEFLRMAKVKQKRNKFCTTFIATIYIYILFWSLLLFQFIFFSSANRKSKSNFNKYRFRLLISLL